MVTLDDKDCADITFENFYISAWCDVSSNKVLKEGQLLFSAGDESDGMYVVRKGELKVYIEQNGKEIVLANVGAGSMIGEMALFDRKPRSASIKANDTVEITHITNDDFSKLMRQIPKWFVGLMATLSTRLRETNERLQNLQAGSKLKPFTNINRLLSVFILLWHKDGEKEGRAYVMQRKVAEENFITFFDEDPLRLKEFFKVLVDNDYLQVKKDRYNNQVFSIANKGILNQLSKTLTSYTRKNPEGEGLSEKAIEMATVFEKLVLANPYDTYSASAAELIKEGKTQDYNTDGWGDAMKEFKNLGEGIDLVKTSDGIGLKSSKKEIASTLKAHRCLTGFIKANI